MVNPRLILIFKNLPIHQNLFLFLDFCTISYYKHTFFTIYSRFGWFLLVKSLKALVCDVLFTISSFITIRNRKDSLYSPIYMQCTSTIGIWVFVFFFLFLKFNPRQFKIFCRWSRKCFDIFPVANCYMHFHSIIWAYNNIVFSVYSFWCLVCVWIFHMTVNF